MSVQLGWVRTFVAVYRLGSFTKAAHQLGLSQPAVTHQIRNLEQAMGRPLFERLPHGAQPTQAADGLIREVQGPIDLLSHAVDRAFGDDPAARPLTVAGPVELTTTRVIPAISDLASDGMRLNFTFGLADDLLDRLEDDEFDLVISTVRPRGRRVTATPLVDEEFVLVASAELAGQLPLDRLATEGPDVLGDIPMISYAESLPIIRRYWHTVFDRSLTTPPALVIPDLRGALAAVKSSAGISVLPTYLCAEELADGGITPLIEPEIPPLNTFYLATRRGSPPHPDLTLLHGHLLMKAQLWI
ncbi:MULTISPECIES: LysR family transcriptional regulator [unclassified Streptomyces]|uniref:LysR family transcriptional regulator n=1 Tax=unclassified Streptomyces TaxID=2593676 RepID=UPI0004762E32|nr:MULTISPECIES: LysR family transcriptional regulator [unclassified Streptomyces]MYY04229.1 LysR family transcriptional regulator [Streptomyces sp. SID4913]